MNKNSSDWNLVHDRSELTHSAADLFRIPPEAQLDNNLVSMANFLTLVKEIIYSIKPAAICEIGAENGFTSRHLIGLCHELDALLYIVDPEFGYEPDIVNLEDVQIFREPSLDFLQRKIQANIYFIDGDHNYYTVINELRSIQQNHIQGEPLLLLMDDVGWPWARRDMYYEPNRIHDIKKYDKNVRLFPTEYKFSDTGLPMDFNVSILEGAEKSGVLSAVEDFRAEHGNWNYISIPSIFGLGLLWPRNNLKDETEHLLAKLGRTFQFMKPFLSTLELNRITLLAKIQQVADEWHETQIALEEMAISKKSADVHAGKLLKALEESEQSRNQSDLHAAELLKALKRLEKDKEKSDFYAKKLKSAIDKLANDKKKADDYAEELKLALISKSK